MSDAILVSGLRVVASVGVLDEERTRPQPLIIDCTIDVDLEAAGVSDALIDTVNYAQVVEQAEALVGARHHDLLESLAQEICQAILALDHRISGTTVSITKVRPPIGLDVDSVGVRRTLIR